jgi:hypothetical protein
MNELTVIAVWGTDIASGFDHVLADFQPGLQAYN